MAGILRKEAPSPSPTPRSLSLFASRIIDGRVVGLQQTLCMKNS